MIDYQKSSRKKMHHFRPVRKNCLFDPCLDVATLGFGIGVRRESRVENGLLTGATVRHNLKVILILRNT